MSRSDETVDWVAPQICISRTHITVERADGAERIVLPYFQKGDARSYTYASVSGQEPLLEQRAGDTWQRVEKLSIAAFQRWCAYLDTIRIEEDAL